MPNNKKKSQEIVSLVDGAVPLAATYACITDETKGNALIQRLANLESQHYQLSVLIEEEAMLGNEKAVKEYQDEQMACERRMMFIRTDKLPALGYFPKGAPATTEEPSDD